MRLALLVLSLVLLNGCTGLQDFLGGLGALGPKAQYSHGLGVPFAADTLYFAVQKKGSGLDPWGSIQRIDLNGQNFQFVATNLQAPAGIALDLVFERAYWADSAAGVIQCADLSVMAPGKQIVTILDGLKEPFGIALDFANGTMYWTEVGSGTIKRADYSTPAPVQTLVTGQRSPTGIALALANLTAREKPQMYWVERDANTVWRADLDGSNQLRLVSNDPSLVEPSGIALDLVERKIYVTTVSKVVRYDFTGTKEKELVPITVGGPGGIALDVQAKRFYYTRSVDGVIAQNDYAVTLIGADAFLKTNVGGTPRGGPIC